MAKYSRTNLIINYLPQAFSDDEFRALFGSVAPVKRAKVCRDKRSGYSFGFGFCEFYTAEDASRAVRMLNGLQLHRKTIKVAHARLQSSESKNCNLHITNLPPTVTAEDIRAVLEPHGGIINCKILPGGHRGGGGARGVGFCLFETRSAAASALAALNGKPWPGSAEAAADSPQQLVQVRFADENEKKVRPPAVSGAAASSTQSLPLPPPPPPPSTSMSSLPAQLPHHQVHQHLSSLPLSLVPQPPQMPLPPPPLPPPLMPQAYDFSTFYAMQQQHGLPPTYGYPTALYSAFPGCPPAQFYPPVPTSELPQQPQSQPPQSALAPPPPPPPPPAFIVSVCNLPPGTDECQLWSMFCQFGGLAEVRLEPSSGRQPAPAEGDLQPPGASAAVGFASYQAAASAVAHWNGQSLGGRQLQVWLRLP
ncbi:hypothetical protein BOX15_Mlig004157g1 [Macrostomum lignano]|uniref:RRM domain-containing protein n=1 Tax=Macrostomum lignano TaxID=282301 RepID=A0A267F147_9PLAT|nr:hypothetical protein BOX15_Mlig004157g1 [Macrostomum lignano]